MRTLVSTSFFGILALTSFALAGCSVATDAEPTADAPTESTAGAPAEPPADMPAESSADAVAIDTLASGLGQACSGDADCESGSCADGVCCATACNGECEACNIHGSTGTCTPHAAGTDPESECATPACFDNMQESFACNGASACEVKIEECGNYGCGESACNTECQSDVDCADGAYCSAGSCVSA